MSNKKFINYLPGDKTLVFDASIQKWQSFWKIKSESENHQYPHLYANLENTVSGQILNDHYIGSEHTFILAPVNEIDPEVAEYLGLNPGVRLIRSLTSDVNEKAYKLAFIDEEGKPWELFEQHSSGMDNEGETDSKEETYVFQRELHIEKYDSNESIWRFGKEVVEGSLAELGLTEEIEGIFDDAGRQYTNLKVEAAETS